MPINGCEKCHFIAVVGRIMVDDLAPREVPLDVLEKIDGESDFLTVRVVLSIDNEYFDVKRLTLPKKSASF